MRLNDAKSLTHVLNTSDTDELNVIKHSPHFSDDEMLQSPIFNKNRLSVLSLNFQSFYAKFNYIRLLVDNFAANNCPLQVLCWQELWYFQILIYLYVGYQDII